MRPLWAILPVLCPHSGADGTFGPHQACYRPFFPPSAANGNLTCSSQNSALRVDVFFHGCYPSRPLSASGCFNVVADPLDDLFLVELGPDSM